MKYLTVRIGRGTAAARVDGDAWELLDATDVGDLLRKTADGSEVAVTGVQPANDLSRVAPVVTAPAKFLCVGHNFYAHIHEMGRQVPEYPTLFAKYSSALIGARDDIRLPSVSDSLDWEVELGVVIGRTLRQADEAAAQSAIAGYTIVNDISARDWQRRTAQWLQGKNFDATTPIGPYLVTGDEIGEAADLRLSCHVNGEMMQDAKTSDLIFGPAAVAAYASQIMTLEPGDVIALGTPGGVGVSLKPPVFLQDSDVVETTIEGLGTLVNRCRRESA